MYHTYCIGGQLNFYLFLEQPSPYFVCICANIILQFSCLKHPDTRDQFLFAFDPFLLFVLYQRDERLERVISLKSTNLKAPYTGVVARALNNVMVKLHKETCVYFQKVR